ncbi:hypothetical protein DFH11DRAFT_901233 [Phellopilus nigrolimitatus]|nr:hypothetical protein DFH11DRAFT_901233 [Phellopilus nigrolimitatus]
MHAYRDSSACQNLQDMLFRSMPNAERVNRAQQKPRIDMLHSGPQLRRSCSVPYSMQIFVGVSRISSDPQTHAVHAARLPVTPTARLCSSDHTELAPFGHVFGCDPLALRTAFESTGFFCCCATINCGESVSSDSRQSDASRSCLGVESTSRRNYFSRAHR